MRTILVVAIMALLAPAALATGGSDTYSCTTAAGLANPLVGLAISGPAGNYGGCDLGTVKNAGIATVDGCAVGADLDGDGLSDLNVETGTNVPAGAELSAFCDLGTVDTTTTVSIAF